MWEGRFAYDVDPRKRDERGRTGTVVTMGLFRRSRTPGPNAERLAAITITEDTPHEVLEPNAGEKLWIADNLQALDELGVNVADIASLSHAYDEHFESWASDTPDERLDPNPLINMFGIGLGEHFVRSTGLQWVVISDEQGTDLAVRHPSGPGQSTLFPISSVAKRWVEGSTGFMTSFVSEATKRVSNPAGPWTVPEKP